MKHLKNLIAAALTLVVAMALSVTAFAAGTGTITITPPSGVDSGATNTYKIYEVFDADASADGSSVSYKVMASKAGKDLPTGFVVDAAGNVIHGTKDADGKITPNTATELTAAEIASIAAYVEGDEPVDTATSTGTAAATSGSLDNGYYFITTSTGSVVTINTAKPNATVNDKNTVPSVDKTITGATSMDENGKKALAQVGTTVNYSAVITVGNGAKDYIFHDTMETGLTYNDDAAVTGVDAANYTVGKVGDDTFTITFSNDYIKTLAAGTKLTITYSATVNNDAITVDPLNNTAYVSYGDKNSNYKTPETSADVYEAKITITKKDGDGEPLAGAGFVLKNSEGKYYKLANNAITWVDSIDAADEHVSDDQGAVAPFTGLANGTYTLVEKTVPSGYNKAADKDFTIAEHDYTATNLEQAADVVNESGSVLPSTGGMGTTLFYIVGGLMVAGAAIALIAKNRVAKIEG